MLRVGMIAAFVACMGFSGVWAWCEVDIDPCPGPNGLHVTDGSYVMSAGELQVNITNFGLIGSYYSQQSSFSDAPSAQWPAGSGDEYLFGAGLWVGGVLNGEKHVSTGVYEMELRPSPELEATIYESVNSEITRPWTNAVAGGRRAHEIGGDDDGDGMFDEEVLDGIDQDGDGLVDEDYEHLGTQMMVCRMVDDSPVATEMYSDHKPLHLDVIQTTTAWAEDSIDDAVCIVYDVTNHGNGVVEDVRLGFFADFDIGNRRLGEAAYDDVAGMWSGAVVTSSGAWIDVSVAYMCDQSDYDRVPGYVGVVFLGPRGSRPITTFQHYTSLLPFTMGGDPASDAERFEALTAGIDPNVAEDQEGDYRILCSPGSGQPLYAGATVSLELAIVVGDGLPGLLTNCADILEIRRGQYLDVDDDPQTGIEGKETMVCLEDYDGLPFAATDLPKMVAKYADASCRPEDWDFIILPDLIEMPDGRHCIWVNMDNCDECRDIKGWPCSEDDFFSYWNCSNVDLPLEQLRGCTGVAGRERYVNWLGPATPDPPAMRAWAQSNRVHIYWSDISERSLDPVTGQLDFEGYQVWRADDWDRPLGTSVLMGPSTDLWQLIAAYDVENIFLRSRGGRQYAVVDTLPLGDNTGLEEARYVPVCLDDPEFAGLDEAMRGVVDGLEHLPKHLPALYDRDGVPVPGLAALLPWESHVAVLDTFYMTTDRPADSEGPEKAALGFYEYVDDDVHNGFQYFYSVSVSDHIVNELWDPQYTLGKGLDGDPAANFTTARPTTAAQSAIDRADYGARIFVYPNPATRQALDDFQRLHPNGDDPTGVRVMFANLPEARSVIRIFSLNGDLVAEVDHDGYSGRGEASWNLVSRNGQQVVSGVYLYCVHTEGAEFGDVIGKFVVIR